LVAGALADVGADDDDTVGDAELIAAVRSGENTAFGVLYERHLGAARRAAGAFTPTVVERDDLVAEGFARVLRVLKDGRGPTAGFRPYLITTMRNTMIDWRRRDALLSLVADVPDVNPTVGTEELVTARIQADLAAAAFETLPERWRAVLSLTEIEGHTPAQVAAQLGMTPNSVSALAYRAREGLRQAYLEQHVHPTTRFGCASVAVELARWVRGRFPEPKMRKIATHLNVCVECRDRADVLRQLNHDLP
jgi:RNA polymerase sigma factor (sigma-70 family)